MAKMLYIFIVSMGDAMCLVISERFVVDKL